MTGAGVRTFFLAGAACAGVLVGGCSNEAGTVGGGSSTVETAPSGLRIERVTIAGVPHRLELAADDASRFTGMSGRTEIPVGTGMLFTFRTPGLREFVMRDCVIPIDIIYLDAGGRVIVTHAMQVEPPRGAEESEAAYNARLRRYFSRFAAKYVIELAGGQVAALGLKTGDVIELDHERLLSLTK
jgi:hypothetical protein